MIQTVKLINEVIAFLLELGMLTAFGYWGFHQGKTTFIKYLFAVGLPIIAIILWGLFAAPKSQYRLETMPRIIFELCLFSIASFMIYKTNHTKLAICFGIIFLISELTALILKQ